LSVVVAGLREPPAKKGFHISFPLGAMEKHYIGGTEFRRLGVDALLVQWTQRGKCLSLFLELFKF